MTSDRSGQAMWSADTESSAFRIYEPLGSGSESMEMRRFRPYVQWIHYESHLSTLRFEVDMDSRPPFVGCESLADLRALASLHLPEAHEITCNMSSFVRLGRWRGALRRFGRFSSV